MVYIRHVLVNKAEKIKLKPIAMKAIK